VSPSLSLNYREKIKRDKDTSCKRRKKERVRKREDPGSFRPHQTVGRKG